MLLMRRLDVRLNNQGEGFTAVPVHSDRSAALPEGTGQVTNDRLRILGKVAGATDLDHILASAGDIQLAVAEEPEVASAKPAITSEETAGRLSVVACRDRQSGDLDLAGHALRSIRIADAHRDAGNGTPDTHKGTRPERTASRHLGMPRSSQAVPVHPKDVRNGAEFRKRDS